MSIAKRLENIEKQNELIISLLSQRLGASEKQSQDVKPGQKIKVPVKRQTKAVKMADYEMMYRKKGIV